MPFIIIDTVPMNYYSLCAAELVRDHVTTINSEIQTWWPDFNFSDYQIWTSAVKILGLTQWNSLDEDYIQAIFLAL